MDDPTEGLLWALGVQLVTNKFHMANLPGR
jgi:hypothetical protein